MNRFHVPNVYLKQSSHKPSGFTPLNNINIHQRMQSKNIPRLIIENGHIFITTTPISSYQNMSVM